LLDSALEAEAILFLLLLRVGDPMDPRFGISKIQNSEPARRYTESWKTSSGPLDSGDITSLVAKLLNPRQRPLGAKRGGWQYRSG